MTSGWHGLPVGRRVVLAEDDAAMREMLAVVLSEAGYQVTTVSDGAELARFLRELAPSARFDLIVTDVNMPGGSGLDVIDQLRQNGDDTPVIVVTAFPQKDILERAHELGLRLLAKPFELDTLRAAVDWAIRANAPHQWRLSWSQ
ncbi:MAG TPA: response regulator [Polyangiaceae bacterium]|nr:response regulator [Polyangiaceae bacterium]